MKATITRDIDNVNVISSPGSASAPGLVVRDQNFPKGNQLVRELLLSYDATISGTSTPTRVTNGHLFYLNTMTLESDKQKNIVDNVEGLSMYKLIAFDSGTAGQATALSATPADSDLPMGSWAIPLTLRRGIRPYDTQIDVLRQALTLRTQYGPVTNLWTQSGGTPLVVTNTQTVAAKIITPVVRVTDPANGLLDERPLYARYWGQKLDTGAATATENRRQIQVPFGNMIFRRIMLEQRNSSTKAEITTVVNGTARVSLEVNNVPFVQNVRWQDLQRFNKSRYSLESLFTGTALIDFDADEQEKIDDMLKLLTTEQGSAYLYVDVTHTNSTDALLCSWDALREIDPEARG